MNLVLNSKATGSGQKMAKTKIVQKTACDTRGVKVKDTIYKQLGSKLLNSCLVV